MVSRFTGLNVYWQINGGVQVAGIFTGNIISTGETNLNKMITGKLVSAGRISLNGASVDIHTDTDGDTVFDNLDDYPLDPKKAYNNDPRLMPQTIAFEDLWPSKGDFDFNDVVMKTSYNYITNAYNQIVQVIGTFTLLATGGVQKNSFHIRFKGTGFKMANLVTGSLTGGVFEQTNVGVTFKLYDNMRTEIVEFNTT